MLEVFAMITLRSSIGLPVAGSVSLLNSSIISAISFPPLAAPYVDDDLRITVHSDLVEGDRLAGTEAARDRHGSAPWRPERASR